MSSRTHSICATLALAALSTLTLSVVAPAANEACWPSGFGGSIPPSGTGGGGSFATVLPPSPLVLTTFVSSSGPGTLTSVRLRGFSHTWMGDLQLVLRDPMARQHTLLFRPGSDGVSYGCEQDFSGDYSIVRAGSAPALDCSGAAQPGMISQHFGVWPDGALGIDNTPLCSIAEQAGTWSLLIYDWEGADSGSVDEFELCFDRPNEVIVMRTGQNLGAPGAVGSSDDSFSVVQTAGACGDGIDPLNLGSVGTQPAVVVAPHPNWTAALSSDAQARWIHFSSSPFNGQGSPPRSVLYSLQFNVQTLGNPAALMDVAWLCDDSIGDTGTNDPYPDGLYLNGVALDFSGGSGTYSGASVSLLTGLNTLHVYQRDGACFVAGLIMSLRFEVLPCPPPSSSFTYCTAGLTTNGCSAAMSATGSPSVSAGPGAFSVQCSQLEGQKLGVFFYGTSGAHSAPWGTSSSFLCVKAPTQRTMTGNSGGNANACDGALSLDLFGYVATHPNALGAPFAAGDQLWLQCWFRDPPSPKTSSLSNALELTLAP